MFPYVLHLFLFLLSILSTTHAAAYNPVDFILLSCGATEPANDTSGRKWESDERSRYSQGNSAVIWSKPSHMDPSVPEIPYGTARIFTSQYKYSFPLVSSGHKFLRFYFYPDTYAGYNTSQSLFSITANRITLVSNFSAYLNSPNLSRTSFTREFIIYADGNQRIDVTFSPNPNSFAFVNGIEIVSIPDGLYFRNGQIRLIPDQLYDLKNDTGLEMLYRLNVGGQYVRIQDDTGMFRDWNQDDDYIFAADFGYTPHAESLVLNYTTTTPPYSAPNILYTTMRTMANTSKSLEWSFPVDSGFYYLLRFHFCEFLIEIDKSSDRMFTININNITAEIEADVIFWAGSKNTPIFKDYIARVPDVGNRGKADLRLSLFPNTEPGTKYLSAFLNGLEIFKLSDWSQSLAAANPSPAPLQPSPNSPSLHSDKKIRLSSTIHAVIGSVIGVLAVVAIITFLVFRQRRKVKDSTSTKSSWVSLPMESGTTRTSGSGKPLPSDLCKNFTLGEILTATENFDDSHVIGKGGFGNVYKGSIDGATIIAVKRLNSTSKQGAREFITEINMLSKLRHLHLVSLIGFCYDQGEMILVYDFMAHGTLSDHLYNTKNVPLKWKERLQICLGAAKGLQYLHTGIKHPIIHRDVKSTNILLDEKWVAKMSDFGLSKVGSTDASNTHVSTAVKGSVGYVDPEYWRLQQLTEKSDVYSFGVVLFEVLCARPAILQNSSREKTSLAEWAKLNYRKGTIDQIVDSNLKGQIARGCLNKFVETAISCLQDRGIERPGMNDVVWNLEFALQLQDAAEKDGGSGEFCSTTWPTEFTSTAKKDPNTTSDDELFTGTDLTATWSNTSGLPSSGSCEKLNSQEVFSEIHNPTGR